MVFVHDQKRQDSFRGHEPCFNSQLNVSSSLVFGEMREKTYLMVPKFALDRQIFAHL